MLTTPSSGDTPQRPDLFFADVTETQFEQFTESPADYDDDEVIEIVPNAMQKEAMTALHNLREEQQNRALLIAATGTGKTYLSIFDVNQVKPKKVLYIAHRDMILDKSDFRKLVCDERIKHIERSINLYRNFAYPVKGLFFCSRVEEAKELSEKLNKDGYHTKYLTGENSDMERERTIQELESDENNFFIPIALYGDNSYNKDNLRKAMSTGSSGLPGTSTVQITEVARQKIYQAISETNFTQLKILKEEYNKLKMRLAKIPTMMDFVNNGFIDPFLFIDYKGSYYAFKCSIEKKSLKLILNVYVLFSFFQ